MARSYRRNFIVLQSARHRNRDANAKVFSSWDFAIAAERMARGKKAAIRTELKVSWGKGCERFRTLFGRFWGTFGYWYCLVSRSSVPIPYVNPLATLLLTHGLVYFIIEYTTKDYYFSI